VELKELIVGRTARDTIRTRSPMRRSSTRTSFITGEIATDQGLKLESIRVRSPLTCESPRGVCAAATPST